MQINRIDNFEKIVEELNKIIDYYSPKKKNGKSNNKKNEIQKKGKSGGNNDTGSIEDDIPKYVKIAKAYKDFYLNCIKELKEGKIKDIKCEPSYKDFYHVYVDPKKFNINNMSDKTTDEKIKSRIEKLVNKIYEYYEQIKEEGKSYSYMLGFCECESDPSKKLCLRVKESPETASKEKDNDEMVVDYGKSEKVLANIKRKGLALYAHFLGVVFPLEFAAIVSVYYIIGFFVALFTHKIFVTNMNDIFEILLFTAIMIIISFIEIYKDYVKLLDSSGKRALSNIAKLSLIPFFSIKEKKFVNTLNKNIVAYKHGDGYITLSIFDVSCPICNNAGHKNRLIARNKKNDVIFECSGEKLHKFSFDKVLKTGKLVHNFL